MHHFRLHLLALLILLSVGLWLPASSQTPAERLSSGQEAFRRKQPGVALEAFRSYLGQRPDGPRTSEVHYLVAVCLEQMERLGEARASLEDWLASAPADPWQVRGWILLADLRARDGQVRGAEAAYTRALEMCLEVPGVEARRLEALLGRGSLRASAPELKARRLAGEADLVEVIRADFRGSQGAAARLALGDLYLAHPEIWDLTLDRAVDVWREMARVQPDHGLVPKARLRSARAFNAEQRHREAREDLEALLRDHPRSTEAQEAARMLEDLQKPRVELPSWTLIRPGQPARVEIRARNLGGMQVEAWKIDLEEAISRGVDLREPARTPPPSSAPQIRISVRGVDLLDHRWRRESLELDLTETGAYLLQVRSGGAWSRGLLLISDLVGVCSAAPEGEALVWLLDAREGRGATAAEAWLVSPAGSDQPVERLTVGESGLLTVPALSSQVERFLLARRGQDYLILPDLRTPGRLPAWRAFLETDRSAYQAGERVRWKAVVRSRKPEGYAVPAGHPFLVEFLDPQGRRTHRVRSQAGSLGTLRGEFQLPQGSPAGVWTLRIQAMPGTDPPAPVARRAFSVGAADPGRLRLRLRPTRSWWLWGEEARVELEVCDSQDRPVPGVQVDWQARGRVRPLSTPLDPELDWFLPASSLPAPEAPASPRGAGKARTDERGRVALSLPLAAPSHLPLVEDLELRVQAVDPAGREGQASTGFVVGSSAVLLSLSPDGEVRSGQASLARVQAWDLEGRPAPVPVALSLQEGDEERELGTIQLDRQGRGSLEWTPRGSGPWRILARSRGAQGEGARAHLVVPAARPPSGDLWLRTDRLRYRPGQLATVDLGTPREGVQVLLTLEGRDLVRRMVVECPTRQTRLELPIGQDLAPGFRLRATTLRGFNPVSVEQDLLVPDPTRVLRVEIEPLTPPVPGQPGRVRVRTLDSGGLPVESEVSLALIRHEALPGGMDHRLVPRFFGPPSTRPVVVGTSLSTAPSRASQAGQAASLPAPAGETAFWSPDLRTGPEGIAEVSLDWPLRPGRWQLLARAVAGKSRMGEALASVDLEARLGMRLEGPEHLVEGDSAVYTAVLENPGREALALRLMAQGVHLDVAGADLLELQVPGGGRQTWSVPVSTRGAGTVELRVTAQAPGVRVQAERSLPVRQAGQLHERVVAGPVEDSAALDLEALPGDSREPRLEVHLSPGLAGFLASALEPPPSTWTSNEDLVSGVAPALVVGRTLKDLDLPRPDLEERLPGIMEDCLRRLGQSQNPDGGWGWWEGMPSDPATTAQVVRGLIQIDRSNPLQARPLIEKACNFLRQAQAEIPLEERPALLLALAEARRASGRSLLSLVETSASLAPAARMQLTLALHGMGYSEAARNLLRRTRQEAEHDARTGQAWWPAGAGWTRVEATALALEAHLALEPEHPLTAAAAQFLCRNRSLKGWGSSRETALAILALSGYLARTGEKPAAFGYGIWLNGNEVETGRMAPEDWSGTRVFSLRGLQLPKGPLRLEIRKGGSEQAWWSVWHSWTGRRTAGTLDLSRRHFLLTPSGSREELNEGALLQPGDRIQTVLELKAPRRLRHLEIREQAAAGLEAEPPGKLPAGTLVRMRPEGPVFHLQEVRPGVLRLAWTSRATAPGEFTSNPARAREVHDPGVHGASLPWRVRIGRQER